MASTEVKIDSLEDFRQILRNTTGSMIHCAVQRKCCTRAIYNHHYIALSNTFCENCNTCDIIHFAKDSYWWEGRVKRVKHYDIQIDITKGLYVYQNDDYPRNNDDYSIAYKRFEIIKGVRRDYSVSLNNCEHVVNYILTGHAVSYQLRRASIFKRILSQLIDLFTDGLGQNLSAAVFNGLATSFFMVGFTYYYYLKIKALLDKEGKSRGMFGKIKKSVFFLISRIFKNRVNKTSPEEQRFLNTLVFLLILDPDEVIGSTKAKTLLQKAAPRLPYFTTVATGISTFIVEGFFALTTVRSLKRHLDDNTISSEDFKRGIVKSILFVLKVILTSLIIALSLFKSKKQFFHPISAFFYGFVGNLASRVFVPCAIEVLSRLYTYLINPRNDLNQ